MRILLILFMFLNFSSMISQEIVDMKEVYVNNNLVYKNSDNQLFTGLAQNRRRNGHLIYEEQYKNGIILYSNLYYNGKEKIISNKKIYNPKRPLIVSKELKYNLKGEIFETMTCNDNGVKILVENFKNQKLVYSCEYLGKKKHGFEKFFDENHKLTCKTEYKHGKEIK